MYMSPSLHVEGPRETVDNAAQRLPKQTFLFRREKANVNTSRLTFILKVNKQTDADLIAHPYLLGNCQGLHYIPCTGKCVTDVMKHLPCVSDEEYNIIFGTSDTFCLMYILNEIYVILKHNYTITHNYRVSTNTFPSKRSTSRRNPVRGHTKKCPTSTSVEVDVGGVSVQYQEKETFLPQHEPHHKHSLNVRTSSPSTGSLFTPLNTSCHKIKHRLQFSCSGWNSIL